MKIEDLQATAQLAHLNLDEAELAGAFPAFEQMLGFFAAMQAADEDRAAFSAPIADLADTGRTVTSDYFRLDTQPSPMGEGSPLDTQPSPQGEGFSLNNNSNNNFNNTASKGLNENLLNNAGERDGRFIVIPNVL
jgi:aspartyl-tRNA(Asn)/glutamyl-tRNA(Gln) amidotransferase subunit C